MERSGIMCPFNEKGRPPMCMLHIICVDNTWWQSASDTVRGCVVALLLITEVPSITNICVAPESAIASPVLRANIAPAKLLEVKK
jgi:hypothetical protein